MKDIITLRDIAVSFDGEQILDGLNLSIHDGEFVTLLGPSGCGKTTTLRIIGGFITPDRGDVFFCDRRINNVPAHKRRVNTIFQRYALFPHMNVYDNVAFGMRIQRKSKAEIAKTVDQMLELVDLRGYEKRDISTLSGGQQQRVAIARALANQPKVLLLDEPLAALDLKLRKEMQVELKNIQKSLGITFVYVTHDQEEALSMSDTVVVMDKGCIQQIGTPTDIYNEPQNAFVADFIGESNIFDGVMRRDCLVESFDVAFPCVDTGFGKDEPVDVVVRPEDVLLVSPDKGEISGMVTSLIFKGVHYEMNVEARGFSWLVHSTKMEPVGSKVGICVDPENIQIMRKQPHPTEEAATHDR